MTETQQETSYDLQAKIAELQRQKHEHEEIERKRQQAERDRLKAIEQAEREIIQLQEQQAELRWTEAKQAVRQQARDLQPALAELVQAVAAVLEAAPELKTKYDAAVQQWEQGRDTLHGAVSEYSNHVYQKFRRESIEKGGLPQHENQWAIKSQISQAIRRDDLPVPVHPSAALLGWIAATDDDEQKRLRAVAVAMVIPTWDLASPGGGYSASADTRERMLHEFGI